MIERNHSVRVLDQYHEKFRSPNPKVDYRISLGQSKTFLYETMLDIDIVFHLASASVPSSSNIDVQQDVQNNLFPTIDILENMVKIGVKKIVYFSSGGAVYGESEKPCSEESSLNPISSYGITKLINEKYIKLYSRIHGIEHLIIRPSNPFGPRQGHYQAQGVISTFLRKIKNNEDIIVFGDGSNRKDYIYIEDLISIVYNLMSLKAQGIFNVASGEQTSLNEIIKAITETLPIKQVNIMHEPAKNYDIKNFSLSIDKLNNTIGYQNFTPLKTGIAKTWEWILER
jgi:UDP-glucose 4-epimerase